MLKINHLIGFGKTAHIAVTGPVVWTFQEATGHGESKTDATGAISLGAAFYWVASAYSALQTLGIASVIKMTPTTLGTQFGGWGIQQTSHSSIQWNAVPWSWQHRPAAGNYLVVENGVTKFDSGANSATSLWIEVLGDGTVNYYRNGSLVYTSLTKVAASFYFQVLGGFYFFDTTFTSGSGSNCANLTAATITA